MTTKLKSFVIRLNGISTSESLAEDCVESGRNFGLHIEKFDGVYGQENIDYYTNLLNVRPWKTKFKKGRLGVKGCFLSHYSLWLKSIELDEPLIIFEHDAVVTQPFPENIYELFDEFLVLDPFNKFNGKYYKTHIDAKNNKQKIVEYFSPRERQKYGIEVDYPMGLQAYIIKPSAALKLKTTILENGYYPADVQCNKNIINLETVTLPLASINTKYQNNRSLMLKESSTQYNWHP